NYYYSSLQSAQLDQFSDQLFVELDIGAQMDMTCELLPRYGVNSGYVVLYENPHNPMERARLIMALHNKERIPIDGDGILFPTKEMLPRSFMQQLKERQTDLIVQTLQHGENKLGYVVFQFDRKVNRAFDVIRFRLAIALKSAISM